MQIDTLLIRNIARAEYKCGQNIEKEHVVRVNKDHTLVYRPTVFLSPNPKFYIQRFSLQVLFNMDPRRTLKSAQEQEDRRRRRNERDRARRAAETVEQRSERLRKRRERDRARRAAQTGSERQATSQQKSTRKRERMACS